MVLWVNDHTYCSRHKRYSTDYNYRLVWILPSDAWQSYRLATKLIGTVQYPVKIDECYLCGRRKYARGRLFVGDKSPVAKKLHDNNENDELPGWHENDPSAIDDFDDDNDDFLFIGVEIPQ